jgi:hypothetical protein
MNLKEIILHILKTSLHDFKEIIKIVTFYHQLDAQTSCLFTYNTLIKILYMFRARPAHFQEVHFVIVYMRSLVLSHSAGDCLVHRLRKKYFFLNRSTRQSPAESDDTRDRIYTITKWIS